MKAWFEALWASAEDYKSDLLTLLERFTRPYSPYEIYIKVIYEALRDRLDQDLGERDEKPSPIALTDFQHDGYLAAREILDNYGGVLIADSVGLGKTFLTLRLLEDYAYRERQTALVICPAAVRETVWQPLLQRFAIPYEIVSMEQVSQKDFPVDEYAQRFRVIVVDESHNFRNPSTNRWPNLFRLITQGDPDKRIFLLTATPVNNTVFDLYHQLRFITRDNRHFLVSAGISDLFEYFRRAEQSREALYEVLEALAVWCSRPFIRQNYPEAEIDGQKIRFPERRLHTVHYSLKQTYGEALYRRIAQSIEELFLAPYQLDTYRWELIEARRAHAGQLSLFETDRDHEGIVQRLQDGLGWSKQEAEQFMMTIGRQTALAHILRVLYLKRLESSVEALRISLKRLHGFLQRFLEALQQGRLLQSGDYRQWLLREGEDEQSTEENGNWSAFVAELPEIAHQRYDVESIRKAVQADLKRVEAVLAELENQQSDNKIETLKELLTSPQWRGQKVLLFSYFKDTARYLHQNLMGDSAFLQRLGHQRISIVDSSIKPQERTQRIVRFAPQANHRAGMPKEEQIDLLISADVLSEGQNLQDAEVLINYDLHWNPVRMVQRIGRVDRIGSPHETISVYNFFPEEELEELLSLVQRLHEKLDAINRTVGLDASVIGEKPSPMEFNILRRVQQQDETVLDELEEASELSIGEFLKQDLLRFLKELGEERLENIPLGMGTAREGQEGSRGFFAAFRNPQTNQSHWLFLDTVKGQIVTQRLPAIRHIRCEPSEPAKPLPEDFAPRSNIVKLRNHLWDRMRAAQIAPPKLPAPQRQVVNWLHALPPSTERNRALQYFESRALVGTDLKDLHRLWRERIAMTHDTLLEKLVEFAQSHPQPAPSTLETNSLAPQREEDLECIAWMLVS